MSTLNDPMLNTQGQHIVILGAGYGGLRAAQHLVDMGAPAKGHHVELVDRNTYHTITTQLHEVTAGTIGPQEVTVSLARLFAGKPITLTQAEVTGFDFDKKLVHTKTTDISYDLLVIALGGQPNYFNIPGLQEHSFTLGSVYHTVQIHQHIEEQFRLAQTELNPERRQTLLTFVIGGGGWTGTELAGELADRLELLCRQYGIPRADVRIIVIEAMPTILSGLNPAWISEAERVLKAKGVELLTSSPIAAIEYQEDAGKIVRIKDKDTIIRTETIIWTGGVRASELVAKSGLPSGPGGRVKINEYGQAEGQADVYVIGDSSLVIDPATGKPRPSSGQLANLQAANVARNIMARLTNSEPEPFSPQLKGIVISIGRDAAVGQVYDQQIAGWPAVAAKRLAESRWLYQIGGPGLTLSRTFGPKPKAA